MSVLQLSFALSIVIKAGNFFFWRYIQPVIFAIFISFIYSILSINFVKLLDL